MSALHLPGTLVNAEWLSANLRHPDLAVLDASMQPELADGIHYGIPGARHFDYDKKICDQKSQLPHMMPSAEEFENEVRKLGINRASVIVIYDQQGVYASPRAWWMFKAMGHEQVAVLDGGLPAWKAMGFPVEPLSSSVLIGGFKASPRDGFFCGADFVERIRSAQDCALIDARSEERFLGRAPEPRPGLRAGHIPGAINLHFERVQELGRMRSAAELKVLFDSKTKGREKLVFSCGSGVTACILALGATIAGFKEITVYDGSWSEWGIPSVRTVR
ncbi:sulfurtransferase [Bdellovibrionota bacterium FG-2]